MSGDPFATLIVSLAAVMALAFGLSLFGRHIGKPLFDWFDGALDRWQTRRWYRKNGRWWS